MREFWRWRVWQIARRERELKLWRKNGDGLGLEQRVIDAQKRDFRKVIEIKDREIAELKRRH